jgi:hypothetical protein
LSSEAAKRRRNSSASRGDVARAHAQRRHLEANDVEPVVEVLAEEPVGDHGAQVTVGGRDDPHVHPQRLVAAHALEFALLQEAQELHLDRPRDLADLVQEQRAARRALEAPLAPRRRARE